MESNMESRKDNSLKAYVLGALIITVSLVIIGVSLSYAYFINKVEEVGNADNKNVNIRSGELVMNFDKGQSFTAAGVGLVNDADITTKAEHTDFSVTLPSDSKVASARYSIFLTELQISDNLKSEYLKWSLYKGGSEVANGTFENIGTDTTLYLSEDISIDKGNTDGYVLYVWLSNDPDNNQIELLNGTFSGKVGFRGVTK